MGVTARTNRPLWLIWSVWFRRTDQNRPDQPFPAHSFSLSLSYFATCYNLAFRAAVSDSTTSRHEFCSFSTNRLAACSRDTT